MRVTVENKKRALQDFTIPSRRLPARMKHTMWYQVRREACAEEEGGQPFYPIEGSEMVGPATRTIQCPRRGLWASWAMHWM